MAASYYVATQQKTVQVFSQNAVLEVEEVGFITSPSNIYAQVVVPYDDWLADQAASLIQPMVDGIENEMTRPEVAGMVFAQDIDPSGLIQDILIVTVQYNPPPGLLRGSMTTEVSIPTYAFGTGQGVSYLVDIPIANALAALQATASL